MSGLDGQVIEQYTSGIFAPSDGQDGYLAVATVTATEKNLTYLDPGIALLGPKLGPSLTDANASLLLADGSARILPAATLTANRVLTLSASGAGVKNIMRIARLDLGAYTLAIVNGGPGGGTLYTFPVSVAREAVFVFDSINWSLDTHWAV